MRNDTKPTEQQLRELYEVAIDFKKAKPWELLSDVDLICIENPEDKTLGYCSIMGRGGYHFALGVYLGDGGLAGFNFLARSGDELPAYQTVFHNDCLMCSFEDRKYLDSKDKKEISGLGFKFSGKNDWPQFRRFEPGFVPWYINTWECTFLTHALRQTSIVANQYRSGEISLDLEQNRTILRSSEVHNGELVWRSLEFQLGNPRVENEPLEFEDDLVLERLKRARRSNIILQVETCYLPMPVQLEKNRRPHFPRVFMLADKKSGLVLDYNLYQDPENDADEVLRRLIGFFLEKGVPREIQVRPGRMTAILEDFCDKVGINLKAANNLSTIDDFLEEMLGR